MTTVETTYLNIERCEDHKYTSKTHEYILVFKK